MLGVYIRGNKFTGNAQFPCQRRVEWHYVVLFTMRPNRTKAVVTSLSWEILLPNSSYQQQKNRCIIYLEIGMMSRFIKDSS
jgi:lipoate-protein ligase A